MFESAVSPRRINRDRSAVSLASRLPIKIFQIGFNKCGTRTIHRYLARNGVRSLHWDAGRLAKRMYANLAEGRELLAGYEEFDAFTDMEYLDEFGTTYLEGYKLYPHLAAQYPNAVFILNTRNREDWIRSRLVHGKKISYAKRAMAYYGAASIDELTERWRAEWKDHHRRVTEFFAGKPHRFFVCPIETDLPHLLNDMLPECNLDTKHYRLEAKTTWRQHLSSHHLSSHRDASFAGAFHEPDRVVDRAGWFSNRAGLRQILSSPWLKHAL